MSFDWDEEKNEENKKKHGIWFEEAERVFLDKQRRVYFDDIHSNNDEDRFLVLGYSDKERVLMVSHCYRGDVTRNNFC